MPATPATPATPPLDFLFLSERALWPLDQGFCVHGYHMAMALQTLGYRVAIASLLPTPSTAPAALRAALLDWPDQPRTPPATPTPTRGPTPWLRRKLIQHQGLDPHRLAAATTLLEKHRPRAAIALGQHGPIILHTLTASNKTGCHTARRRLLCAGNHRSVELEHALLKPLTAPPHTTLIWYAADELAYFHLSCLRREPLPAAPIRLRKALLGAALERFFARRLHGIIGVSPRDTSLLRCVTGNPNAVTIRNGVDTHRFCPHAADILHIPSRPHSLAFWGRMDFEPNIDAVIWFARHVWPLLRTSHPDATWTILGKNPTPAVQQLARLPGITVLGEVPDIRPYALAAAVTILPTRCGAGIKNKLLEAAALARPIVASPKAVQGLLLDPAHPPVLIRRTPNQWARSIQQLWADPALAARLGRDARTWVHTHHTWHAAAQTLIAWLHLPPPIRRQRTDQPPVTTRFKTAA